MFDEMPKNENGNTKKNKGPQKVSFENQTIFN